jgi:general secretion pathway protein A
MYSKFFNLKEQAFENTPDPRFFHATAAHEEALASLVYTVARSKGLMLLTGEPGTGKSLLVRMMLAHFGDRVAFASVEPSSAGDVNLIESACADLGIDLAGHDSWPERLRAFQEYLIDQFAVHKPVVLVVEDAHLLSDEAFQSLLAMSKLDTSNAKLLQVVLVGTPDLRDTFGRSEMTRLRQQVFRSLVLPPLDRDLVADFVRGRLLMAGAEQAEGIFDASALDAIHEISKGIPRVINTLCENALIGALKNRTRHIDGHCVRSAAGAVLRGSDEATQVETPQVSLPETTGVRSSVEQSDSVARVRAPSPSPDIANHLAALGAKLDTLRGDISRRTTSDGENGLAGRLRSLEAKLDSMAKPAQSAPPSEHERALVDRLESIEKKIRGVEVTVLPGALREQSNALSKKLEGFERTLESVAERVAKPAAAPLEPPKPAAAPPEPPKPEPRRQQVATRRISPPAAPRITPKRRVRTVAAVNGLRERGNAEPPKVRRLAGKRDARVCDLRDASVRTPSSLFLHDPTTALLQQVGKLVDLVETPQSHDGATGF